jgi:hypothetical protein
MRVNLYGTITRLNGQYVGRPLDTIIFSTVVFTAVIVAAAR